MLRDLLLLTAPRVAALVQRAGPVSATEDAAVIPGVDWALDLELKDPEPCMVCGSGALASTLGAFISSSVQGGQHHCPVLLP